MYGRWSSSFFHLVSEIASGHTRGNKDISLTLTCAFGRFPERWRGLWDGPEACFNGEGVVLHEKVGKIGWFVRPSAEGQLS
jgi:hypothetical protein